MKETPIEVPNEIQMVMPKQGWKEGSKKIRYKCRRKILRQFQKVVPKKNPMEIRWKCPRKFQREFQISFKENSGGNP